MSNVHINHISRTSFTIKHLLVNTMPLLEMEEPIFSEKMNIHFSIKTFKIAMNFQEICEYSRYSEGRIPRCSVKQYVAVVDISDPQLKSAMETRAAAHTKTGRGQKSRICCEPHVFYRGIFLRARSWTRIPPTSFFLLCAHAQNLAKPGEEAGRRRCGRSDRESARRAS